MSRKPWAVSRKNSTADNLCQKFTTYQRDEESGLDFAEARMYENATAGSTSLGATGIPSLRDWLSS